MAAKKAGKAKAAAPKRGRGQPTKCTAKLTAELCAFLEQGWFLEQACAEVGVTDVTVRNWLAKGQLQDAPPVVSEFFTACTRARARGERLYLERIRDKSASTDSDDDIGRPGDWKADAWTLERLNQNRYKATTRTEVTGAEGGALQIGGLTELMSLAFDGPPDGDGGG